MKPQYIKINEYGDKFYYSDKELRILHREDGPAIEGADGSKIWYLTGQIHREDGPSIEWSFGDKDWYLNNKKLTKAEFNARKNKKPSYMKNNIVTVKSAGSPKFPVDATCRELHNMEGSLWLLYNDPDIHMFCQVAVDCFAMIVLSKGNRSVDSFDGNSPRSSNVRESLNGFTRFYGEITISAPISS